MDYSRLASPSGRWCYSNAMVWSSHASLFDKSMHLVSLSTGRDLYLMSEHTSAT